MTWPRLAANTAGTHSRLQVCRHLSFRNRCLLNISMYRPLLLDFVLFPLHLSSFLIWACWLWKYVVRRRRRRCLQCNNFAASECQSDAPFLLASESMHLQRLRVCLFFHRAFPQKRSAIKDARSRVFKSHHARRYVYRLAANIVILMVITKIANLKWV